jgi:hypothetical protein
MRDTHSAWAVHRPFDEPFRQGPIDRWKEAAEPSLLPEEELTDRPKGGNTKILPPPQAPDPLSKVAQSGLACVTKRRHLEQYRMEDGMWDPAALG